MAKIAVKQVWRHPETRLAFVYFADANTGAALSSLDGYTVSEAGSNINAPVGTQSTSAQSEPTQEESPVNTPLTTSEDRGGGEAFAPQSKAERAAKAQELMSMPGATVDENGIVSVPTPSSGGFMSYDPNTGWSAYTNKDGITTTFDAQGNILGGPGLASQLGTKSGSTALFEDLKSIPVLGSALNAVLAPIGGAITNVIDKIMGQTGTRNPDGTVTYQLGEDQPNNVTPVSINNNNNKDAIDPFTNNTYSTINTSPKATGDFSTNVRSFGDDAVIEGNTTPSGVTSKNFLGTENVTQGFYGRDLAPVDLENSLGYFGGNTGRVDKSRSIGTGGTKGTGFSTVSENVIGTFGERGRSGFGDQDVIDALNEAAAEAGLQGWTNEDAIAFAANFAIENGSWGARGNQAGWDASRQAWSGEKSYGLGQWNQASGRFQALQDFAKERGLQWDTLEAQSKFTIHELQTSYKNAWGQIRAAPNVQAKTALVMTQYEKPLDQSQNKIADRVAVANKMAAQEFLNVAQKPLASTAQYFATGGAAKTGADLLAARGKGTFSETNPPNSLTAASGVFDGIQEDNVTNRSLQGFYNDLTPEQRNASRSITNDNVKSINFGRGFVGPQGLFDGNPSFYNTMQNFMGDVPSSRTLGPSIVNQQDNRTSDQKALDNLSYTVPTTTISMPADSQAALSAWSPTYAQDIGVPNPNSISTLGLGPRAVQTTPVNSPKSEVVPIGSVDEEVPAQPLSWAQQVAGNIIGWAIDKTLADSRPQQRATETLAPSSGFMGSSSASFRDAQNEKIREGLQLKDDLGAAAFSGIYNTVYDTLKSLNDDYQTIKNYDTIREEIAKEVNKQNSDRSQQVSSRSFDPRSMYGQPMDSGGKFGGLGDISSGRSVFSDIGNFAELSFNQSQAEQAADRQEAQIAAQMAQAAAAATNYGGGSVSTAGPSGGFDSGVYSGPSGWESSGGGGVWDSLGSGSAIDYGGGDSYGGGWASSAGSATGTAGSGVSSAGSSGTGTAGSASSGGLSGAASEAGTAGGSSGGFNSAPGSTSGGYGGYGGWSGDGGWW